MKIYSVVLYKDYESKENSTEAFYQAVSDVESGEQTANYFVSYEEAFAEYEKLTINRSAEKYGKVFRFDAKCLECAEISDEKYAERIKDGDSIEDIYVDAWYNQRNIEVEVSLPIVEYR